MPYLLDTCAWIDALLAPELLSQATIDIINGPERLHLSTISLLELARKEALGKITLNMPCYEWLTSIAIPTGKIILIPMTPQIVVDATRLPGNFEKDGKPHKDPADQIITATARLRNYTLLTSDQVLLDYAHVNTLLSRR